MVKFFIYFELDQKNLIESLVLNSARVFNIFLLESRQKFVF